MLRSWSDEILRDTRLRHFAAPIAVRNRVVVRARAGTCAMASVNEDFSQ